MRVKLEATAQEIELNGSPLGSGGEATIYALPDSPVQVAKVYHKPKPDHADKLKAMIAAPPVDPMAASGHASIAWPTTRLLALEPAPKGVEPGGIVGYVMPRVDKVRLIQEFYNPKSRLQLCPLFHYGYLLRTARNLAAAVRALHDRGYIIGDLNESNLLVTNQALVTLVDTDSFQVPSSARTFRCTVGKPEYTPPELQGARFGEIDRASEHDAFGLGVLIFQLLMQGTHPFAGIYSGAGEPAPIPKRIAAGHWPYAQGKEVPFKPSPLAPPWSVLPPPVQELMRRCFEEGHAKPAARPTTTEWQRALQESEKDLITCTANAQHLYHRSQSACPWCVLAKQQGRDLFPSPQELKAQAANGPATIKIAAPATINTVKPEEIPSVIPVPSPAEELWRKAKALDYAKGGRWLAAGVAFIVAAAGVAFISWKLTHKPKPAAVAQQEPAQQQSPAQIAEVVCRLEGHTDVVTGLSYANGSAAVSGSADRTLRWWNLQLHEWKQLEGPRDAIAGVGFGHAYDGAQSIPAVVAGCLDGTVGAVNLEGDNKAWRKLYEHPGGVTCITGDFGRLASGGKDRLVRVWSLRGGSKTDGELMTFRGHTDAVTCVAFPRERDFDPNVFLEYDRCGTVLSGSADGSVRLWKVGDGREVRRFNCHRGAVTCLAVSRNSERVVAGGVDGTIRVWDMAGQQVAVLEGHEGPVTSVVFTSNSKRVFSGGEDRTARLWDLESQREVGRLEGHDDKVSCVAFSSAGDQALTASGGVILVWKLFTPEDVEPIQMKAIPFRPLRQPLPVDRQVMPREPAPVQGPRPGNR